MKKIFLLALAVGALLCTVAQKPYELTPEYKLRLAEQVIETFYVDRPDTTKMVDEAIIAMLKTLDPHSSYSTPEETKELTEPLEGNFSGIGIRFQMHNDTLNVMEVISGGPSQMVGIQAADKIISCNDAVISGVKKKNRDIMKVLRGPRGTLADLKVLRRGVKDTLTFRVTRADIPIYSVDASYMVNPTTGYIRIARFAESTTREVKEAMKKLQAQGMQHLVLDLTDNGGGYMKPAYEVANIFLEKGSPLVYTENPRDGRIDFNAEDDGTFLDGEVVVMVNQYSASASEILSGALQDNDRATIVGRRTFGKGLVQRPFPFPDGSMMRLTVSRYHTPSGRCIQKPYKDGDDDAYKKDIVSRLNSGELMSADSIHMVDSLLTYTLKKHRPVYGGGGILPDIFVPLDTTYFTPYYRDLVGKGVLSTFCFDYVQLHKPELLNAYPSLDSFIKGYEPSKELWDNLVQTADKEGVKPNPEQLETSREYLRVLIKALMARDLWGQDAYFRVANEINPIYRKALEAFKN